MNMKTKPRILVATLTLLGLGLALPSIQAQDAPDKVKIKEGDGESKIKIKDNKVKVKGKAARDLLKPEVTSAWVQGYTVPDEYREYFTEVPVAERDSVVVRYRAGRAYYINQDDWSIVRVVDVDPSVEVSSEDSVYVTGYVIPEARRTQFVEVPAPDSGVTVRYYNNTAYYMDPSYRIVRTVPLAVR